MSSFRFLSVFLFMALFITAGCDTLETNDEKPLEAVLVEDLPADPITGRDLETGEATSTKQYTFYSLRAGEIVLNYDETDRADSASTAWDIGFRGTNLIFNGGSNGPGNGGVLVLNDVFEDVTEAPEGEYTASMPSDNNWYNYDFQTHVITPVPGRTMVVRTADGRYAKLRILSYYKGAPAEPTMEDTDRYFTFEYVFQEDGSRNLSVE